MEDLTMVFHWPEDDEDFEYGIATREDAAAVNDLYNQVFEKERPLEHYLWKAWGSPAGDPVVAYARNPKTKRIKSCFTGVRRNAWVDGTLRSTIMTCETCTDPDARGGGTAYRNAVRAGMGFGNEALEVYFAFGGQSTRAARVVGKRFFGYHNVVTLEPLQLRLSLAPALERRLGTLGRPIGALKQPLLRLRWRRLANGYELREALSFGAEFDWMWELHRGKYRVSISRDAATLHWRYTENPLWSHRTVVAYRDGEPRGYAVWREWAPDGVQVATMLDFWDGNDLRLAEALLDGARRMSAADGCTFLQFSVLPGRPQEAAMRAMHNCQPSKHLESDHMLIGWTQGFEPGMQPAEVPGIVDAIYDPTGWYYTQGDSDLRD
jgi:hypothetical protein